MIFVGLRARNQLILVKIIDFRPLVPQKLSVESSINDDVHQKRVSSVHIYVGNSNACSGGILFLINFNFESN